MTSATRIIALRYTMIVFGVIYIVGIHTLIRLWPSGWSWGEAGSQYLTMMLAVYATLGVFLILGSRDPLANRSLIWFTVWSNVAHSAVMTFQAITMPMETGHLLGDVPALLLLSAVLAILTPRQEKTATVTSLGTRRVA
jgi:hypothetical protein